MLEYEDCILIYILVTCTSKVEFQTELSEPEGLVTSVFLFDFVTLFLLQGSEPSTVLQPCQCQEVPPVTWRAKRAYERLKRKRRNNTQNSRSTGDT